MIVGIGVRPRKGEEDKGSQRQTSGEKKSQKKSELRGQTILIGKKTFGKNRVGAALQRRRGGAASRKVGNMSPGNARKKKVHQYFTI